MPHGLGRAPLDGLSHVHGDTDTPLLDQTIPDTVRAAVAAFPENDAAIFLEQGIRWSYAEFAREIDRLAGGLLHSGVGKGDRVGIWSPNRFECVRFNRCVDGMYMWQRNIDLRESIVSQAKD